MATSYDTGAEKASRSDVFLVSPTALVVDWGKNVSRNGEEPPVDDALMELARDMMPRQGQGDSENGSSGQLNPIIVRPLPDKRLEVVGGFRRLRAALWLIESGTCPDFKVKYVVLRLSDSEAALVNMAENLNRLDPNPIQLAFAVRTLTEDYGLPMKLVAGRLKKSTVYLSQLLNLTLLPESIRLAVSSGKLPVSAAFELVKMPAKDRDEAFEGLSASGGKITAAKARKERQAAQEASGTGKPIKRTAKQLIEFLQDRVCRGEESYLLSTSLVNYLNGTATDYDLGANWSKILEYGLSENVYDGCVEFGPEDTEKESEDD